jgi:hypothetical protein
VSLGYHDVPPSPDVGDGLVVDSRVDDEHDGPPAVEVPSSDLLLCTAHRNVDEHEASTEEASVGVGGARGVQEVDAAVVDERDGPYRVLADKGPRRGQGALDGGAGLEALSQRVRLLSVEGDERARSDMGINDVMEFQEGRTLSTTTTAALGHLSDDCVEPPDWGGDRRDAALVLTGRIVTHCAEKPLASVNIRIAGVPARRAAAMAERSSMISSRRTWQRITPAILGGIVKGYLIK